MSSDQCLLVAGAGVRVSTADTADLDAARTRGLSQATAGEADGGSSRPVRRAVSDVLAAQHHRILYLCDTSLSVADLYRASPPGSASAPPSAKVSSSTTSSAPSSRASSPTRPTATAMTSSPSSGGE